MREVIGFLIVLTILWLVGRIIAYLLAPLSRYIICRVLWGIMLKMGQQPPGMNEFANRLDKYFWKACRRYRLKLTDEARLAALMPMVERYGLVYKDKTRIFDWQRGVDLFVYQLNAAWKASVSKSGKVDASLVVKVLVSDKALLTSIFTERGKQPAACPA